MIRYFVEISHVIHRKLDEIKFVTQPVKIIRNLDPFKPKKGKGKTYKREWSSEKKGEPVWEKSRVREGEIYFLFLIVEPIYHYYHWIMVSNSNWGHKTFLAV